MAFVLKKTVQEILELPEWERYCWKQLFTFYGPLDWRRDDYLFARVSQALSTDREPLREFVLFKEPQDLESARQTEDDVLAMLGYVEEDEEEN